MVVTIIRESLGRLDTRLRHTLQGQLGGRVPFQDGQALLQLWFGYLSGRLVCGGEDVILFLPM